MPDYIAVTDAFQGAPYDLPVVPRGHSTPTTCHRLASQPPNLCPLLDYLVKWNTVNQNFLKTKFRPEGGFFKVPEVVGLGTEIDESKILRREVVP